MPADSNPTQLTRHTQHTQAEQTQHAVSPKADDETTQPTHTTPTKQRDLHREIKELREQNQQLVGELRFASGLIALLLLLGFWNYWQSTGPVASAENNLTKPGATLPTTKRPTTKRPTTKRPTTNNQTKQTPPPQHDNPTLKRKTPTKSIRRKLARRRKQARRRYRFGDPVPEHKVPSFWCPKGYRYGPYYPCVVRRKRRCLRRSKRKKYSCLPKHWKRIR